MRLWLAFALTLAALAIACSPADPPPAFGPPPRDRLLQSILSNTDVVDGVRINERTWLKTYAVSAQGGLASVRRQLDRLSPESDDTGQRFDGLTTWALHWTFAYDKSQAGCRVRNATIEVEAVITVPDLEDIDALSAGELALWRDYADRLRSHEDGHVEIYLAAARNLREQVLATGPLPDCRALAALLEQTGNTMIDTVRSNDQLYDAATGHGAIFPSQ
jgi:predicted secreted Zn-dependent protease